MLGDPSGALSSASLETVIPSAVEESLLCDCRLKNTLTPAFSIRGKPQGGPKNKKENHALGAILYTTNSTIFYDFVK
jgi:hypothetical protein